MYTVAFQTIPKIKIYLKSKYYQYFQFAQNIYNFTFSALYQVKNYIFGVNSKLSELIYGSIAFGFVIFMVFIRFISTLLSVVVNKKTSAQSSQDFQQFPSQQSDLYESHHSQSGSKVKNKKYQTISGYKVSSIERVADYSQKYINSPFQTIQSSNVFRKYDSSDLLNSVNDFTQYEDEEQEVQLLDRTTPPLSMKKTSPLKMDAFIDKKQNSRKSVQQVFN